MLEQCGRLPILRVVPLQTFDKSDSHGSVEERIFPVDFFAAAPARVARKVGLRSPQHQHLTVILSGLRDESGFIALHASRLANQVRVPRLTHARRLRELRRRNGQALAPGFTLNHSMDAFGAAIVRDAKPRHAGACAKAVDLLVNGHERKQVVDPLFHGQRRIVERIVGLLRKGRGEPGHQKTEQSCKTLLDHGGYRAGFPGIAPGAAHGRPAALLFANATKLSRPRSSYPERSHDAESLRCSTADAPLLFACRPPAATLARANAVMGLEHPIDHRPRGLD